MEEPETEHLYTGGVGRSGRSLRATEPVLTEWVALAGGLVDGGRKDALLAHASECDACGAVL